jgi:tetraacyldisaccharide 4'-kinase
MKNFSKDTFQKAPTYWENKGLIGGVLWPLSLVFSWVSSIRKTLFEIGILSSESLNVPVVIVGNVRVGGTGKTPSVLAIAKALHNQGFKPGIISRGYKGDTKTATEVTEASTPVEVGDEPCYMAQQLTKLSIPVFISSGRVKSAQALLKKYPNVDVIISDDGLQHYKMKRWPAREGGNDIELVIRDDRGEGNGWLLPAGPLREKFNRERDYTLHIGEKVEPYFADAPCFSIPVELDIAYSLGNPNQTINLKKFSEEVSGKNYKLWAAAGLGNPKKFFNAIKQKGLKIQELPLPDHYDYVINPFENIDASHIFITEKDSVKCARQAQYRNDPRIWVIPVNIELPKEFINLMVDILKRPKP